MWAVIRGVCKEGCKEDRSDPRPHERVKNSEAKNLIGCCGLYCGLCNKYQSQAPSRCIGCKLGEQHAWCSIWNCCEKKHGFETCVECNEISDCAIFLRRKVAEWIPAADNLRHMKEVGLTQWLKEQKERQTLIEELLHNFNEGRSMSFYCKACSRMPIGLIKGAIQEAKAKLELGKADEIDMKSKAKIVKAIIKDLALEAHINLD